MKYRCIISISLLACALAASGEETMPQVGACASLESGAWSAQGTRTFADCLALIQLRAGRDAIGIGRWAGVLLAQDGLGTMTSQDQGKTWQAYRGQAPAMLAEPDLAPESAPVEQRPASTEPWPPPPATIAAAIAPPAVPATEPETVDVQQAAAAPQPEAAAAPQPEAATPAPSLVLDQSLSPTTAIGTAPIEPLDAEIEKEPGTDIPPVSAADPESLQPEAVAALPPNPRVDSTGDAAAAASTTTEVVAPASAPNEPPAAAAAEQNSRTMAAAPAAGAATPAPPQEPADYAQRDPDECRIRVTTGWIRSSAPTLKDCAKLLDQSPENYDSQGYKYAYWRDALLVATKFEVFTFDEAAQWTRVLRRYRY